MFTTLTSKGVVVLMMTAMVNLIVGCNNMQPRYPLTNNDKSTVTRAAENETPSDDIIGNVELLTTSGSAGWTNIDWVLGSPFVQPYLEEFQVQGYHFSPGHSFVVESFVFSNDTTDSVHFTIVEIAMLNDTDTTRAAYIRYSKSELGHIISPYMLSFVDPAEPGFEYVTDGIWRKHLPGEVVPAFGKNRQVMAATLDGFLDCVAEKTAIGCAVALITCGVSGPLYPKCVAAGCAGAFVYAVVSCAFDELDEDTQFDCIYPSDPWCDFWVP